MGTIRLPMKAMFLMDMLMSGENFKSVTHMLEQMEAFVEKMFVFTSSKAHRHA